MPEQTASDRGPWIATLSGTPFYIEEMNIEDIPLNDIAHALSMNCRYNGHISRHYSVAEHSVIIADILKLQGASREVCLQGLMHDVSEAFIPDIPRPFKGEITGFQEYEEQLLVKVALAYDFYYPFDDRVLYLDRNIVRNEAEQLFPNPPHWVQGYDYIDEAGGWYMGLTAEQAKRDWLDAFEELKSVD
jgi:hypothetical protein